MEHQGTLNRTGSRGHEGAPSGVRLLLPPVVGGLVLLIALLALIGTAISDPRPHDIPVGLVGPAPAVQQISTAFGTNAPGAFQFTSYGSEAEARRALDSRSIDGALVLDGPSPRLIVAGAAGDASTSVITAAITNIFKAQGATVAVETVHPFAAGDSHGLVLFFVVVAVIISTLVTQALLFGTSRDAGFGARLIVVLAFAVLAGPVAMGTAAWIAGGYGSGFWTAVGLVLLAAVAVGTVVSGSARLLGAAGVGLVALVAVLLALVLHYFGSKEGVFRAAVDFPVDPAEFVPRLLAPGLDGLGERIVQFFLETWDSPAGRPLLALIRSVVSNEDAAALLREFVTREVLGRLARSLEVDQHQLRVSLAASTVVRAALLRYGIKLEQLGSYWLAV